MVLIVFHRHYSMDVRNRRNTDDNKIFESIALKASEIWILLIVATNRDDNSMLKNLDVASHRNQR